MDPDRAKWVEGQGAAKGPENDTYIMLRQAKNVKKVKTECVKDHSKSTVEKFPFPNTESEK